MTKQPEYDWRSFNPGTRNARGKIGKSDTSGTSGRFFLAASPAGNYIYHLVRMSRAQLQIVPDDEMPA
jgi:hypothetical protein